MQNGPVLALLGEPAEQNEWKEKCRISGGSAEELKDDVQAETLTGEEALMHRHVEVMANRVFGTVLSGIKIYLDVVSRDYLVGGRWEVRAARMNTISVSVGVCGRKLQDVSMMTMAQINPSRRAQAKSLRTSDCFTPHQTDS